MILEVISSLYQKHRKNIFFIGFFIGLFFVLGDGVFAEPPRERGVGGEEDKNTLIQGLEIFLKLISAFLGILTSFVSLFLYPGWTNGTLFGLNEYLREIWILISNVVYFMFAGVLIVIAFMNIIGKGEGNWELKQAMPKFIVGVLMVPFSWFFVQLILSITAILTVGVLTLPYEVFKEKEIMIESNEKIQICTDIEINLGKTEGGTSSVDPNKDIGLGESIKCLEDKVTLKEFYAKEGEGIKNSTFGIISIYTYSVLSLDKLDTIKFDDIKEFGDILDVVVKVIFDLIFVVVYFLLMVALFLALFVRGIWLWIYMMMSPAFGLLYFFGKSSEGIGEGNKFSIKEFISLALVPVYVSAALAFGLVFIFVTSNGLAKTQTDFSDGINVGGINLNIKGAPGATEGVEAVVGGTTSNIGKLIVQIFGIVVLWIAVMSALKSSTTTNAVVQPIAEFGKSVGQLAAKAPTYAPIIPTGPGNPRLSATGLQTFGSNVAGTYQQNAQQRGSDFAGKVTNASEVTREYQRLSNKQPENPESSAQTVDEILKAGKLEDLTNNTSALSGLSKHLKHMTTNDKYFRDKTKANELIDQIQGAQGNKIKIDSLLAQLDQQAKDPNVSILGGSTRVEVGSVDKYMGKDRVAGSTGSGDKNSNQIKPTVDDVTINEKLMQKVKIDNNTTIYVNDEGKIDAHRDSSQRFMTHLRTMGSDGDGKNVMTATDFKKALKEMGINEREFDNIIKEVDEEFFIKPTE